MSWLMENNNPYEVLHRHKKKITCDICTKRLWFFQKSIRAVVRTKENIWVEYYHIKCLEKRGFLRRIQKQKSGRWDNDDPPATSNIVH